MAGAPVYLDSTDLVDLRTLFTEGVLRSDVIVLLATEFVLTRPWCILELWHTHQAEGVDIREVFHTAVLAPTWKRHIGTRPKEQ